MAKNIPSIQQFESLLPRINCKQMNRLFICVFLIVLSVEFVFPINNTTRKNKELIVTGSSDEQLYQLLCNLAERSTDSDSILYYSNLAIGVAEKIDKSPARALSLVGLGYLNAGNQAQALEHFFEAAKLYTIDHNKVGLASVYTYVSDIYIAQKNEDNAKIYLNKAIKLTGQAGDSLRLASALHNLAYLYYRENKPDSALLLFENSKAIYNLLNYEQGYAYCIGNIGLVFSKMGKFNLAEENFKQAIQILEKYNDVYAIADFLEEYAKVLFKSGRTAQAIQYGNHSYSIAASNNLEEQQRDAALCLSDFYNSLNQYDSAYFFLTIYTAFNDSLKSIETVQKLADLRTNYEIAQKQAEVDILNKKRNLYVLAIASMVLILFLASFIIYLYYNNLKKAKKLSQQLEDRQTELENLNQIKDKFLSIISHDLRSPISSLGGISILINESIEQKNHKLLNEASSYIDHTVYSLSGLLENLLNWALSQQGKFPVHPVSINLKELISEEVKLLSTVALSKKISIKLELDEELHILADQNSMRTIIRNLLSNAFKFTPQFGSINLLCHKNSEGNAEIHIIDNGIGISSQKIEKLFQLSADKSTRGTSQEKGIGLGLNLVHEFVLLNNGSIRVNSKEGKGTSFILNFASLN